MKRYLLRRAIQVIPLFLIVTMMTFGLMHLAPGGPEQIFLAGENPDITPQDIYELREKWGLNDPFHVQYGKWLYNVVVKRDLGNSYRSHRPVVEAWMARLPATMQLAAVSFVLIYALAIPLGVISAVRQYSAVDYTATTFSFLGYAMPNFWVGSMLIFLLALNVSWIPTSGYQTYGVEVSSHGLFTVLVDRARFMILPVLTFVTGSMATLTRYMRNQMLEVLKEDYVRTARAKGLSEKIVIFKHALRNALLPIVTASSGLISGLIGGSVVIEQVFGWPGIGTLSITAVNSKDYPVVMALLLFGFIANTIAGFLVEIIYVMIDPRIKYS